VPGDAQDLDRDHHAEDTEQKVLGALRKHFRPEFLNRIEEVILFHPLSRRELGSIVRIQMARVQRLLAEQNITLDLSDAALAHIADLGYDPVYGARPLKRAIRRELETPIATKLLEEAFVDGDHILVDCVEDQIQFRKQAPATEPELAQSELANPELAQPDSQAAEPKPEPKPSKPKAEPKPKVAKTPAKAVPVTVLDDDDFDEDFDSISGSETRRDGGNGGISDPMALGDRNSL
jgi:ATP-dependent Clp protease ATP-binding subunit ClpB